MRTVRRAVTLLASVAFSLSIAVGPAYAAASDHASGCAPWESASTARGGVKDANGVIRERDTGQVATDLPARAKGKAPAGFSATVEVYFHVITDGSVGDLTDRQIRNQIAVLNNTFGGGEGGADTGFSFELAGVTRTDNAKWYASRGGTEHEYKRALKQGDDSDLNVYTNSGWFYLGWAYYPSITDTNQSYLDGIVIDWRTVPGASDAYEGRYDLGETLTHEAGHWLNLAHTFEGGCKEPGDFVADTPAQDTPTSGCPVGKDTCTAPGVDPIHNYMDYSFDSCYTEFTPGQAQRAHDAWLFYRA